MSFPNSNFEGDFSTMTLSRAEMLKFDNSAYIVRKYIKLFHVFEGRIVDKN